MPYDHPSRTYTMPAGVPFLQCLAEGLVEHLGERLADALILLPTRRAVRELGNAFVESGATGKRATLLPRMRPLADIDSEETGYEPDGLFAELPPAIPPLQRRFELARLAARYHTRTADIPVSAANAIALAEPLAAILDDAAMEEADLPDHEVLEEMRARAAEHFQHTSVFYEILRSYWPEWLEELGLMDPKARQVAVLDALRARWETEPPDHPVIVAGSTGTLAATRRLIATIRTLPRGMVVLPGVDRNLRQDEAWDEIGIQHPQSSLKALLEAMGVERGDVHVWPCAGKHEDAQMRARRRIISEALVPIKAAQDWPARIATMKDAGIDFAAAVEGLSLIEARHDEEEALAIALILREALEGEDTTAALVTPDSGLARRVRTRLARWGVEVDFSQGQPLEETALGAWLTGLVSLAMDAESAVDLAYVCKHGLTGLGLAEGAVREAWLAVEPEFRGKRPSEAKRAAWPFLQALTAALQPLTAQETLRPDQWAVALAQAAEAVAATDTRSGAERLWAGDAGEQAATLIEHIIQMGDLLEPVDAEGFHDIWLGLMRERVVRDARGTHPRLSILGPLEARMISANVMVLGGLNEGVWPAAPSATPFLSREMRRELGLSLPERRFGLSAHDFAQLASHRRVVLTRAERTAEGPAVASRWLWRLKTLLDGALGTEAAKAALAPPEPYLDWARELDRHDGRAEAAEPPTPKPPVEARWANGRKISITRVKTWVRDPYAIYAREVLGLEKLKPLGEELGPPEWGTMIHAAIESFFIEHRAELDADGQEAEARLARLFEEQMIARGWPETDLAKERSRLRRLADKIVDWARMRKGLGWEYVGSELRGEMVIHPPEGEPFTIYGYLDHVEAGPDGYELIDYKTGVTPGIKEVQAGFDPQLPLAALMAAEGEIGEWDRKAKLIRNPIAPRPASDLIYAVAKGYGDEAVQVSLTGSRRYPKSAPEYAADAKAQVTKLIAHFDDPDTAYHSQPRRKFTNSYGDYDHLARRGEWAQASGDDG